MSWTIASELLLVGLAVLVIGGMLTMKGIIRDDANTALPPHHPIQMTLRRSLPPHSICRVGVALMIVGAICIVASYFARL